MSIETARTTSTSATAGMHNSAQCMCLDTLSDTYGDVGTISQSEQSMLLTCSH